TVVVIPNDKLLELVPRLALNAAFKVADDVLMRAIKGITEVITKPGLVNLDFNDIKTIMKGGGVAMIGLGESDRDTRAEEAIEEDPGAWRACPAPSGRRHRAVRSMADIVDKSWDVQRRIEERAKRLGKGRYGRVLKMARKPTQDEYSKVVLITGLGIAAIGA